MKKRRNWLLVLFGVLVLTVFVSIGAIVAVTAWVQQNMQVQNASITEADTSFDEVRKRHSKRKPLLELQNGRPAYTSGPPDESLPAQPLSTLHVLAWDDEDQHLARVQLPFWVLRMKSTPFELESYASGIRGGVDVSTKDLERYGAGIILDATTRSGDRVLLWTE